MKEGLLVGSYSKNGLHKLNFEKGIFEAVKTEYSFENCSYLCKNKNAIYNIVEYSDNSLYQNGYVVARDHKLSPIADSSLSGIGPCFLASDNIRNMLYIANYGDGSIDVFTLNIDGTIKEQIYHKNHSPNSRIHYLSISQDNRFLFAIDLGNDTLYAYEILENNVITFELKELFNFSFPHRSGPRHMALKEENLYIITETSCELYHFSFSEKNGFSLIETISILPKITKKVNYTGCAIQMSNDASFIYTSIRGHNSISVFEVGARLKLIQNISCFGTTPRDINFNASQEFLFCANQDSDNISIFKRDKKTGLLNFLSTYPIESPACIINL